MCVPSSQPLPLLPPFSFPTTPPHPDLLPAPLIPVLLVNQSSARPGPRSRSRRRRSGPAPPNQPMVAASLGIILALFEVLSARIGGLYHHYGHGGAGEDVPRGAADHGPAEDLLEGGDGAATSADGEGVGAVPLRRYVERGEAGE